jgi:formamidopyrimidine-DNA glycosylase
VPERPDLEYVIPILDRELRGRSITGVQVRKPIVLRLAVEGTPESLLIGRRFGRVSRRAHFVLFDWEDDAPTELIISPMLAGRFSIDPGGSKNPGDTAIILTLNDGRELRYRDDVQMGKVYVIRRGAWEQVPGLAKIGVDVLDAKKFTRESFRKIARKRRDQAKVFLMDKAAIDAMGNAYADEVLWAAQLHPKAMVRTLSDEQLDRLHDAIVSVLSDARKTIADRKPPLDEKLRDFLKVRGRRGEPCPRCATTIRSAGVHGHDADFCPHCQPDDRGSSIVDWRRARGTPEKDA